MARGLRENPATLTIDVTWSDRKKEYVATLSYLGGSGRHGQRKQAPLQTPYRSEIDWEGAQLLLDALRAECQRWLF